LSRCWWIIPVILATEKVDIRRIEFKASPKQRVQENLSQKKRKKKKKKPTSYHKKSEAPVQPKKEDF
jgi:hypothetical protein